MFNEKTLIVNSECIKDFSEMNQLMGTQEFVCSEVNIETCYSETDRSATNDYRFVDSIIQNSKKDFYIIKKFYRTVKKADLEETNVMIPKQFLGAYKTHNEMDVEQLKRIRQHIEDRKGAPMADFDLECTLSMYKGKSIFSMQEELNLFNEIEF